MYGSLGNTISPSHIKTHKEQRVVPLGTMCWVGAGGMGRGNVHKILQQQHRISCVTTLHFQVLQKETCQLLQIQHQQPAPL